MKNRLVACTLNKQHHAYSHRVPVVALWKVVPVLGLSGKVGFRAIPTQTQALITNDVSYCWSSIGGIDGGLRPLALTTGNVTAVSPSPSPHFDIPSSLTCSTILTIAANCECIASFV
jgi:hypothetical protein